MDNLIADKYALALFEAARDQKAVEAVGKEAQALKALLSSQAEVARVMDHPRLSPVQKLEALSGVMPHKPSPVMARFLTLLFEKKRAAQMGAVADGYEALQLAASGQALVKVVSSAPLSDAQRISLVKARETRFGVKAVLREEVKKDLLGGMAVTVGDQRLDATVTGSLERLKQELLA